VAVVSLDDGSGWRSAMDRKFDTSFQPILGKTVPEAFLFGKIFLLFPRDLKV